MVKAKGDLAVITDALRAFILKKASQGTTSAALIAQKCHAQWNKNVSADQVKQVLESAGPDALKAIREETKAKSQASRKQKDLGLERLLKMEKVAYRDAMNPSNGMSGNSIAALNSWAMIYKQVVQYQEKKGNAPEQSSENAALLTIVQELYLVMTPEQHAVFDPRLKDKLGKEWDRIIGSADKEE
jgi:Mg2+/Co2+ transporter CorB